MSLNTRSLLAASVVLAAFLGLTGLTLDKAFQGSMEEAAYQRLEAQVYGLLAVAELDMDGRMVLPDSLPEGRYGQPGSGLYAAVATVDGRVHWQSPSLLGRGQLTGVIPEPGTWNRATNSQTGAQVRFTLSLGVAWVLEDDRELLFTFSVGEGPLTYQSQLQQFRGSLWGWLGGVALLLLAAQVAILRWSLAPLRQVERDMAGLEAGRQSLLDGDYPRELRGLTASLNALLEAERRQLGRYRDALSDLAHSLKTPLAVLRGAGDQSSEQALRNVVREQGERMTQIVDYQLQRAATSGRTVLMQPVALDTLLKRITDSLLKVYHQRDIRLLLDVQPAVFFQGDEGDLMELLGNLLDNAFKWCAGVVAVQVRELGQGVEVTIDDDGPGIPEQQVATALERGGRIDPSKDGQGIGLAVAGEIVAAYGGRLDINTAPGGGARIRFQLGDIQL